MSDLSKFEKFAKKKETKSESKKDFSGIDLSNLKANINKAIEFSQNISEYWGSGDYYQKQQIQKLVFSNGIQIDTQKRQYLTSKVNALFSEKRLFIRNTEGDKKEKPTEIGGLSCLVAWVVLLSAFA